MILPDRLIQHDTGEIGIVTVQKPVSVVTAVMNMRMLLQSPDTGDNTGIVVCFPDLEANTHLAMAKKGVLSLSPFMTHKTLYHYATIFDEAAPKNGPFIYVTSPLTRDQITGLHPSGHVKKESVTRKMASAFVRSFVAH